MFYYISIFCVYLLVYFIHHMYTHIQICLHIFYYIYIYMCGPGLKLTLIIVIIMSTPTSGDTVIMANIYTYTLKHTGYSLSRSQDR